MSEYVEIEDPKRLVQLHGRLSKKLKAALPHREMRTIGHPAGAFEAPVRFQRKNGDGIFYWSPFASDDHRIVGKLFGHGSPHSQEVLNIDLQFNLPAREFHRQSGGAFVIQKASGSVILAHRGIATLGRGRVNKDALLDELAATVREVETRDGPRRLLLIAELDSPFLSAELREFAVEFRRAVRAVGENTSKAQERNGQIRIPSGQLRSYFDEFAGDRTQGKRPRVADCYHGRVVKAIRDFFSDATDVQKSQAIDLTVERGDRLYLFEVKTSAAPQSIYTAIGQIIAHRPTVAAIAPKKRLVPVIVLPTFPAPPLRNILERQLNIRLVLFTRTDQGKIDVNDSLSLLIA